MYPPTAGPMAGISPPPTAGSLHTIPPGMPVGPPSPPPGSGYPMPMGPMGPPTAPPSAQSLGPSMPMSGMMPGTMNGPAPPMSGQMPGGAAMGQFPYQDPHMGAPMNGFGPEMGAQTMHQDLMVDPPFVEVRAAPYKHRPEHQGVGDDDDEQEVLRPPIMLANGEKLPSGSSKYRLYGALEDIHQQEMADQMGYLKRRRRINIVPLLNAVFLPWVLFNFVFALTSFYVHYVAPATVMILNTVIVVGCIAYAYRTYKDPSTPPEKAFYPAYLAFCFLVAASLGWFLGDLNFWFNMQPAYNVEHLGTYNNVNPSQHKTMSGQVAPTQGKRYQDAGKVYFDHKTVLDLNRSMSFKMGDLYCVAPIVDPSCKGTCGFDFWAVGINCCAEDVADFRCGEYKNPAAKAGLRLMHDDQRPNFRLAVLEAEGVHKVVSTHPIFVYWLKDPNKELQHIKRTGFREFVLLMIVSFLVNMGFVYFSLKSARESFAAYNA